jgi:hypothetical protein
MKKARLSLAAVAVLSLPLALSACAEYVEDDLGGFSEPAEKVFAAPGGRWMVFESWPAGAVSAGAKAPLWQEVTLDEGEASDAAGRVCPNPTYEVDEQPESAALGGSASDPRDILTISCNGSVFSRYVRQPDGTLLARQDAWLLHLRPTDMPRATPAEMAASPAPGKAVGEQKQAATHRYLVYLASYRTEARALLGWQELKGRSKTLASLSPVTKTVTLKGKGTFVRLFAAAPQPDMNRKICSELGRDRDCGAQGRE